jgi:hypothetical protein
VEDETLEDMDDEDVVEDIVEEEDEELAAFRGAQTLPRDAAFLKVSA